MNLPNNPQVIYDIGSDELFYLDLNQLDEKADPKVVSFVPGIDLGSKSYELIAGDFW